jgi:hypothetical protein
MKVLYYNTRICFCLSVIGILIFSCNQGKKPSGLLEIPIDIDQNSSILFSEIVEEIAAIELELTDESLINPNLIRRAIISENYVIIAEAEKVLLFNRNGKFLRMIGSKGQGPGEHIYIENLAFDEKNKRLFILSQVPSKIICYDLNGKLLKERFNHFVFYTDINIINDELLLVGVWVRPDGTERINTGKSVFRLNDDFHVIDSCIIRSSFSLKNEDNATI